MNHTYTPYSHVEPFSTADYSARLQKERFQRIQDKMGHATPSVLQSQPKGTPPNQQHRNLWVDPQDIWKAAAAYENKAFIAKRHTSV